MKRTAQNTTLMIDRLNKSIVQNVRDKQMTAYLMEFMNWFLLLQRNSNSKWQAGKARFEELKTAIQGEYQRANKYNDYKTDTAKLDAMTNEYLTLQKKWIYF